MNILMSGGSGYIGSTLAISLISKGHKVGIISRTFPIWLKDILHGVDYYKADITEHFRARLTKQYDIFIHLAGANDIESNDPKTAMAVTVLGTRNVLNFCERKKIKKIIYFSTFQVYGLLVGKVNEKSAVHCLNDYAITHYFAEQYIKMASSTQDISYLIVRPSNIYGCPVHKNIERWTLVPNCFCQEAIEKQTITLHSSGKQFRAFISLHDVVDLTEFMCHQFEKIKGRTFNMASGESYSIVNVANIVSNIYKKMFGSSCLIEKKSNIPEAGQKFLIDVCSLSTIGYIFSKKHTIEYEVERIFKMLLQ